jgi:leucyl/phenylalanyl-tRNA--protein transferase
MPIYRLDDEWKGFPPPEETDESGILAIGGDLSPERLLNAYLVGVFPWFEPDEMPLWWCPDPRCVLFPEKIKVSKSMQQALRSQKMQVTVNQDFLCVIKNCKNIFRPTQASTWISDDIIQSYYQLHQLGYAHSVEVWQEGELVGGLYGLILGKCFFGESMFSKVSNASKVAFITLARHLATLNFEVIDCQVHNDHLESMGAELISRADFLAIIRKGIKEPLKSDLAKSMKM